MPSETVRGDARFDASRIYRYLLTRTWDESLPRLCWVMLNPSTATGTTDDPTTRRVVSFTHRWGYGSAAVVNLFALRTPHPRDLTRAARPVGPANDETIAETVLSSDVVVTAWGNRGTMRNPRTGVDRSREVNRLLMGCGVPVSDLGRTRRGQPRHPLYLPGSTRPLSQG